MIRIRAGAPFGASADKEVQTVKTKRFEMRLSDREYEMIREKMKLSKMQNMSAFMRKMSLDGMVINLELNELKIITSLMKYIGNNMNLIARKLNESKNIYCEDFKMIEEKQDKILKILKQLYLKLAQI